VRLTVSFEFRRAGSSTLGRGGVWCQFEPREVAADRSRGIESRV
jgi:hypothetical protein